MIADYHSYVELDALCHVSRPSIFFAFQTISSQAEKATEAQVHQPKRPQKQPAGYSLFLRTIFSSDRLRKAFAKSNSQSWATPPAFGRARLEKRTTDSCTMAEEVRRNVRICICSPMAFTDRWTWNHHSPMTILLWENYQMRIRCV